jgi:hypothetical protein
MGAWLWMSFNSLETERKGREGFAGNAKENHLIFFLSSLRPFRGFS